MTLDVAAILSATGARAIRLSAGHRFDELSVADLETGFREARVDSRQVEQGDLFVALPGEQTDGHRFIGQALRRGALGAMVQRVPDDLPDVPGHRYLFVTPNPLQALQSTATLWRRRHAAEVIGITGSIGKTTTKEIIAGVLSSAMPTLRSEANLNTEIGVPMMLLRLGPEHRAAVLEMGMYVPGDIGLLARIAEPRIGIVTNVHPIHLERAGSLERIARGKSELIQALPPGGLAILNADDAWTRAMAVSSGIARVVLVGTAPDAAYRAEDITSHGLDGYELTVRAEGGAHRLRVGVAGTHTVHAVLAAIATGREMDLSWTEIATALEALRLDSRQRITRRDDFLLIDDSYNAAPMSVKAALDLLRAAPGRKIAVLGDMLELGEGEETAHREVGEYAAAVADWLVARGPRSAGTAEAAARRGMDAGRIVHVDDNQHALEAVQTILRSDPGKWSVLVKGSRGMRMEEIVHGLENL
ncbi:MAG TPA: UDP-N-acetylmuramoyl-tripeptide--D-alanyl-D-alanine ligase [Chloroflexota bacterium]|nr:UDP-N-acetylmuramoyl-tripeptide--D-alanyl-D-alanine ligase [Chloroflexota bacterium]